VRALAASATGGADGTRPQAAPLHLHTWDPVRDEAIEVSAVTLSDGSVGTPVQLIHAWQLRLASLVSKYDRSAADPASGSSAGTPSQAGPYTSTWPRSDGDEASSHADAHAMNAALQSGNRVAFYQVRAGTGSVLGGAGSERTWLAASAWL